MIAIFSFFRKIPKIGYAVALITFLIRTGYFMSLPFLAVYLTEDSILTPGQIGFVIGISGIVFSFAGLFTGNFVDRRSPRYVLIVALILSGCCYFAFQLSMKLFFALLLVNGTIGLLRSLGDMSAISLLVTHSDQENLSYAYCARFMAINLGLVFGPLIGAFMVSNHSLMIFYIAGLLHILVGIALIFFGKKSMPQKTKPNTENWFKNLDVLRKDKTLINVVLINFLIWVTYTQIDSTVPQYITQTFQHPGTLVGAILVINAIICVIFQPPILHWAEKRHLRISGTIGSLLYSITFVLIAFFPYPSVFLLAAALLSFGELFTISVSGLHITRNAPPHLVASYNGFLNLGSFGMSVGPIIGGYGLEYLGSKYLFLGIAILPLIVLWVYLRKIEHEIIP